MRVLVLVHGCERCGEDDFNCVRVVVTIIMCDGCGDYIH